MEWDEEGHCSIRVQMFYLSDGKGGPPETARVSSVVGDTYVEMEEYFHGLHYWVAYITTGSRFHMGYSGSVDKANSFFVSTDKLHHGPVCVVIFAEIGRVHRMLLDIVFDRDKILVSCFWESFQEAMGIELRLSSATTHKRMNKQSVPIRC